MLKFRFFLLGFLFILPILSFSQPLSSQAKFSILTCDPGAEVYALHGHSALRVQDQRTNLDIVCNWGVFDPGDSEMEFAISFAKGKMDYLLEIQSFSEFIFLYQIEKRAVRELELDLSIPQKKLLWESIQENNLPKNRAYRYDFFFNNCATIIRDRIANVIADSVKWYQHSQAGIVSFRTLIDENLYVQPWSDFGIDFSLGAKTDHLVSNSELMFLPLKMEEIMAQSLIGNRSLVTSNKVILDFPFERENPGLTQTVSFLFWIILFIGAGILFLKWDFIAKLFDGIFFTILGLGGIVILFLWFGTEHTTTDENYNILWANPIHFIIPMVLAFKKWRNRFGKLFLALSVFYFLFVLFWYFLPQEFNSAARPMILTIGLRYYYWFRRTKSYAVST
ncbi:MAG: DUF4105 domain-containing protein [Crocinitomicaceae bacterium]|nr:DUF4105 domain-containing protein [Crocinitomicaceae bacterium]